MRFIAALLALLCGIVLLIKMDTGTLTPEQITGIAIVLLSIAFFLPSTWPVFPHE